jgi:hypothetical protein
VKKTTELELKIFLLGPSLYASEWAALLGDKYRMALAFPWAFTSNIKEAQVIAWNGTYNKKSAEVYKQVEAMLKEENRILVLENEAKTLFDREKTVSYIDLHDMRLVALPSGGVLPEDLLSAIDTCHKKLHHV